MNDALIHIPLTQETIGTEGDGSLERVQDS